MTAADFLPIIKALIASVALAITAIMGVLVPVLVSRAIAAFERRTGVILTAQQVAAVRDAAQTQAGIVETELQQGVLKLNDIAPGSPVMIAHAKEAMARVPEAAAAVGASPAALSAVIVGAADTAKAVPVTKGQPNA